MADVEPKTRPCAGNGTWVTLVSHAEHEKYFISSHHCDKTKTPRKLVPAQCRKRIEVNYDLLNFFVPSVVFM